MSDSTSFDLGKLRRNWAEPEVPDPQQWRARLGEVPVPVDFLLEVPRQMAALRAACEFEFSAKMPMLVNFLNEVEQAGAALLAAQAPQVAQPSAGPLDDGPAHDPFAQDPQVRFDEAMGSLEDLLEVFMTAG